MYNHERGAGPGGPEAGHGAGAGGPPAPSEPTPTVKTLIKSFDSARLSR